MHSIHVSHKRKNLKRTFTLFQLVFVMNAICIIADSWRVDYLGCYGNSWIKTPNIDRFALESALFNYAYSEYPFTPPTREAWHTGTYTFPFGIGASSINNTLGNVLQRFGYNTACISDITSPYWVGFDLLQQSEQWRSPKMQRSRGEVPIDKFYKDYGDRPGSTQGTDKQKRADLSAHLRDRLSWKSDEDAYVARVVKNSIKWLESMRGRDNVFLWMDSWDPHEPWDPPSPYDRMYTDPKYEGPDIIWPNEGPVEGYLTQEEINHIKNLYAGKITMVDKWVGILLKRIKELGFWDNSLIIFTSDHGEPFGEHGYIRKYETTPHEYLSHIPLLIKHPDGLGKGKRFEAFVDTTDIMPTLLDYLEISPPRGMPQLQDEPSRRFSLNMHGHSLLPIIKEEVKGVRDYSYSGGSARYAGGSDGWLVNSTISIAGHDRCWSIRDRKWRYFMWLPIYIETKTGAALERRKSELYNLIEDPKEQGNLIDSEPEVANDLELKLRRFISSLTPKAGGQRLGR